MIFLLDKLLAYLLFPAIAAALTKRGTGARVLWYFGTVFVCMCSTMIPMAMQGHSDKSLALMISGALEFPELVLTCAFGVTMCIISGATRYPATPPSAV